MVLKLHFGFANYNKFLSLALKIKFRGQANVRWSETHSNGKTTTTRTYTARENYFDHTVSVFGKGIKKCLI